MPNMENIYPQLWRLAAIAAVVILVGLLLRLLFKKPLRGERRIIVRDTLRGSELKVARGQVPAGFIFGRRGNKWTELLLGRRTVYQHYGAEGHIVVFGGSGKGKTTALLIPTLRAWPGPFFCIDISGDICKNVPGEHDLILAPDDPERSATYNVFAQIDAEQDEGERRELMEQLVNIMIPVSPKESSTQQYFLKKARVLLLGGMLALYGQGYDFCEVCRTVFFCGLQQLYELVQSSGNDIAWGYMQTILSENQKNVAGAKSTLDDHIRLFAENKKMAQILRRPLPGQPEVRTADLEDAHIFLVVPDNKQEYYSLFQSLVVAQMMAYISNRAFDRHNDMRILLALDEFASLRHLELLGPMRKFRKNGANICLLTQSLADIDLVYSTDERKVILDNAQYIAVLSAKDNDTRTYFSELVGKRDARKQSTTSGDRGGSTSTSYQQEYAVHPNAWKSMGKYLIVIHDGGYAKLLKNYYFA